MIGPIIGGAVAAPSYLAIMEAAEHAPPQAPEIGESALPPTAGDAGAPLR